MVWMDNVAVQVTATLSIHTIIVVDDEVAYSSISQKLMQSIAKGVNIKIHFYTMDKFIDDFKTKDMEDNIFVVVKNIQVIRKLVEGGVICNKINIGNIHYEKGRVAFNKKMYVTKEDIEDIQYLISKNCDVFYQDVPGTAVEKLDKISKDQLDWRAY